MVAKRHCNRITAQETPQPTNPLALTGARSRAVLLAGASLIALAALAGPDRARAACVPSLQTISAPTLGPVLSNGGAISVTSSGSIEGGPDGVDAVTCSISTLTNNGAINGATGAMSAVGGLGVSNSQTITTLNNRGAISGGNGGSGFAVGGAGGAGVSNSGTIKTLTSGKITGGAGGNGGSGFAFGGAGGAGVSNGGTINALTNLGSISGGDGGNSSGTMGVGGAGGQELTIPARSRP